MLGGMGDALRALRNMGQVRETLQQVQERAARRTVTGESGGGMVKVTANGAGEVLEVALDAEALKEPESLSPLIAAAVNAALKRGREVMQQEAQEALSALGLPPGMLGQGGPGLP